MPSAESNIVQSCAARRSLSFLLNLKGIAGFRSATPITSLAIPCARDSFDDNGNPDGRTFAYSDPTDRYREVELDFARDTGLLGTVFLYLSKMCWAECHRTWGQGAIHRCK